VNPFLSNLKFKSKHLIYYNNNISSWRSPCYVVILACPESFLEEKTKRENCKTDSEQVGMTEEMPPRSLAGKALISHKDGSYSQINEVHF
jgi:hypothetical protein